MGPTEYTAREPAAAARDLLDATETEPVYVLDQPLGVMRAVLRAAYEGGSPALRVVAPREELVTLRNEFPAAATAAALVADGRLAVRSHEETNLTPMFVTSDAVRVMLAVDGTAAVDGRTAGSFVADAPETARRAWERADEFDLRAPSLDRITRSMAETFGDEFRTTFETALTAARDADTPFDAVGVILALAARHEELYYEVSRWGDETGVASEATFSRRKRRLEDAGLLDTEKHPIEMGRPRQRLVLPDAVADHTVPELVAAVADAV